MRKLPGLSARCFRTGYREAHASRSPLPVARAPIVAQADKAPTPTAHRDWPASKGPGRGPPAAATRDREPSKSPPARAGERSPEAAAAFGEREPTPARCYRLPAVTAAFHPTGDFHRTG